jgi:hypothetical protein
MCVGLPLPLHLTPLWAWIFGSEQYPTKKLFRTQKKKHFLEFFVLFFWGGFCFGGPFLFLF